MNSFPSMRSSAVLCQMSLPAFEKVVFLGTSAGAPSKQRNTSCIGFRLTSGRGFLVDIGEAAQHQLMRHNRLQCPVRLTELDSIFLTHLHGDHCFGIFGLLATLSSGDRKSPFTIVGPNGIREMVECVYRLSQTHLSYPLQFVELDEDRVHQLPSNLLPSGLSVTAVPLSHRVRAFGYVFKTPERTGKLDASKAAAAGARGPQLGLLKSGQSVTLNDGRILNANDFLGPSEPGIQVAVIQDTCADLNTPDMFATNTVVRDMCEGSDLLIHECTFGAVDLHNQSMRQMAIDKGHSTSEMVGLFCSSMKSPPAAVVLTHISPRYSADSDAASKSVDGHNTSTKIGTDQLLDECSTALNRSATRVLMAHDMLVLDATRQFAAVPTPDPASVTM